MFSTNHKLEKQHERLEDQRERIERQEDRNERKLEANDRHYDDRHEYGRYDNHSYVGAGERQREREHERLEDQRERLERKEERNERKMDNNERRYDNHHGGRFDGSHEEHEHSPVFHVSRRTKVLISPGAGAGWITEAPRNASDAFLAWMIQYEPLIRALEHHEHKERIEEILKDFHGECHVGHHIENIRTPRAADLIVQDVNEPFEIKEHEGKEKIEHVHHVEAAVHRRVVRLN